MDFQRGTCQYSRHVFFVVQKDYFVGYEAEMQQQQNQLEQIDAYLTLMKQKTQWCDVTISEILEQKTKTKAADNNKLTQSYYVKEPI